MVRTRKSKLLDHFLNECVYITTDISAAVPIGENGEIVEAPLIVEGIILDYDADFILVGQDGRDFMELIRRNSVIGIKQKDEEQEAFDDPNKPNRDDLN